MIDPWPTFAPHEGDWARRESGRLLTWSSTRSRAGGDAGNLAALPVEHVGDDRLHPVVHGFLHEVFGDQLPSEPEQTPIKIIDLWQSSR